MSRASADSVLVGRQTPEREASRLPNVHNGVGSVIEDEFRTATGEIAVEFRDPDNHSLEIYWGVDQVGSDGRVIPFNECHGVESLEKAIANPVPGQDTQIFK